MNLRDGGVNFESLRPDDFQLIKNPKTGLANATYDA